MGPYHRLHISRSSLRPGHPTKIPEDQRSSLAENFLPPLSLSLSLLLLIAFLLSILPHESISPVIQIPELVLETPFSQAERSVARFAQSRRARLRLFSSSRHLFEHLFHSRGPIPCATEKKKGNRRHVRVTLYSERKGISGKGKRGERATLFVPVAPTPAQIRNRRGASTPPALFPSRASGFRRLVQRSEVRSWG